MSKKVIVTIDEKGDTTVDILGGQGPDCHKIQEAFAQMGKVLRDEKKPEYFVNANQNTVRAGR